MNILDYAIVRKIAGGSGGGGDDDWYIDNAKFLFHDGARLNNLELFLSKTKDVTSTQSMFYNCTDLTSLDLSNIETSKVTDMNSMFCGCTNLTSLDLSNFNTTMVDNMGYMFQNCTNLTSLDLSSFRTGRVTAMRNMFYNCTNLTSLDLSSFSTSNVTDMYYMFQNCTNLVEIIGFSARKKAGININFPCGTSSSPYALKRLTFRTDLKAGVYSIRSAINIKYCSFERDGMVEMFNTLPDVSSLGLSASYTTITITGNPCVTDGTLTAEDEAIATSKGWTLVK